MDIRAHRVAPEVNLLDALLSRDRARIERIVEAIERRGELSEHGGSSTLSP